LREGRGNTFTMFLKGRRKRRLSAIGGLETPEKIRELQRKLYQKANQERKPLDEDDWKAGFGKTDCPV